MKHPITAVSFVLLISCINLSAQTTIPIPAQLSTAQTIFVANAGSPDNSLGQFAYKSFYHSILNWKRFRLVSSPAGADLSFELTAVQREGITLKTRMTVLVLIIRDVKTQNVLWSLSEPASTKAEISISEMDATTSKLVADYDALIAGTLLYEPAPRRFSEEEKKK